MKNFIYIEIKAALILFCLLACSPLFFSCEEEDGGAPPVLERVSLVPKDSTMLSGGRGETLVIFGSNLATVQEVYFSGSRAPLNTTMVRNDNIIIRIPDNAPFPGPNVLSTVRVVTLYGEAQMEFEIEQPAPNIRSFIPAVGSPGESITIRGEFFNGLASVQFIDAATDEALDADIVSHTLDEETGEEVVVAIIPDGAKVSYLALTTPAGTGLSSNTFGLNYAIYTENLNENFFNWSWGGVDVFTATNVSKSGLNSYRRTYNDGWSGIQLHYGPDGDPGLDLSGYTAIKFSVYGGPGTTGKQIQFTLNWGDMVQIQVVEGQWTDYSFPLSEFGNPATLQFVVFQDNGNTSPAAPYLVYIDDMGLL